MGALGGGGLAIFFLVRPRGLSRFLPTHEAALEGPPNSATRFLAAANDVSMTVVEAWNIAQSRRRAPPVEALLQEGSLAEAVDRMERHASELKGDLKPLFVLSEALEQVKDHLVESWEYTIGDSSLINLGSRRRTILGYVDPLGGIGRQNKVMTNYHHTFTFNPQAADQTLKALEVAGRLLEAA